MRSLDKFEEYDLRKLREALSLLEQVYGYYYGFAPMRKKNNRLETIIKKLESLLNMD